MTLLILIPIVTLAYSWIRLLGLGARRLEGRIVFERPLPLLSRLYMHAAPAGAAILATLSLAVPGEITWWWVLIAAGSSLALIAVPLRYTLTTIGMRRTCGPFRRWTEFAGVTRAPGGARLVPIPGSRPSRIWLSGARGDDEFLQAIRTLIRNAYKGTADPAPMPVIVPAGEQGTGPQSSLPSIAAFRKDA